MTDLFRRISNKLRQFGRRVTPSVSKERRRAHRFICSTPVLWEVGREQGEGQLREVSATGLRIFTDRAFLAGKHVRVRPLGVAESVPLSSDVAIGVVVYSRVRSSGYDVGIELLNPERISRFAWIGQLTRQPSVSAVAQVLPQSQNGLRLLRGGVDNDLDSASWGLRVRENMKKNQKSKGNE